VRPQNVGALNPDEKYQGQQKEEESERESAQSVSIEKQAMVFGTGVTKRVHLFGGGGRARQRGGPGDNVRIP